MAADGISSQASDLETATQSSERESEAHSDSDEEDEDAFFDAREREFCASLLLIQLFRLDVSKKHLDRRSDVELESCSVIGISTICTKALRYYQYSNFPSF